MKYRERIGFTQIQVAQLLGNRKTTLLSKLEKGLRLPSLTTALRLAIIYRAPVDFLFTSLYEALREKLRKSEANARKEPGDNP